MRLQKIALTITLIAGGCPVFAQGYDVKDLPGTYTSDKQGFVHIRKLVVSKTNKGTTKVNVTLAGFPDDIPLGEATLEAYPNRDKSVGEDKLIVTVSNGKLTDMITISHGSRWADWSTDLRESIKKRGAYAA